MRNECAMNAQCRDVCTIMNAQREMAKIVERRKKRKYFEIQIPKHLKELDRWLQQDFKLGSKVRREVRVKYRGDKGGKPSWPAEVIGIERDFFLVKWTQKSKLPPDQQLGQKYKVHKQRGGAKSQYR